MRNRKTDEAIAYSPCEIYRQLLVNPPRKKVSVCEEKINLAALVLTGEVFLSNHCSDVYRYDKKAIANAEQACIDSLKDYTVDSHFSSEDENHENFNPKPK